MLSSWSCQTSWSDVGGQIIGLHPTKSARQEPSSLTKMNIKIRTAQVWLAIAIVSEVQTCGLEAPPCCSCQGTLPCFHLTSNSSRYFAQYNHRGHYHQCHYHKRLSSRSLSSKPLSSRPLSLRPHCLLPIGNSITGSSKHEAIPSRMVNQPLTDAGGWEFLKITKHWTSFKNIWEQ